MKEHDEKRDHDGKINGVMFDREIGLETMFGF